MSHQHGRVRTAPAPRVSTAARATIVTTVILATLAALFGVVHWWPNEENLDSVSGLIPLAVDGMEIVHGELVRVQPACTGTEEDETSCGDSSVRILDGTNAGRVLPVSLAVNVVDTGLQSGDTVLLWDSSGTDNLNTSTDSSTDDSTLTASTSPVTFYGYDRGSAMIWLAILFALAVILVAWRRGLMALISLGFAGVVVVFFLLPSLVSGQPAIPVTLAASTLILVVILYLTHGFSMRTSVALVGALIGLALSTGISWLSVIGTRIGGLGEEAAGLLSFNVSWVSVQHLVIASVILAGIGTLNDVTVTQASALWELRAASPQLTRWELFRSGMRIGRDHVASTVYTLLFAYLGTALVLLVAVQLYGSTFENFITADDVAEEVVRALAGGIALALAMPVTTAIGSVIVAERGHDEYTPAHIANEPWQDDPWQDDPWQKDD